MPYIITPFKTAFHLSGTEQYRIKEYNECVQVEVSINDQWKSISPHYTSDPYTTPDSDTYINEMSHDDVMDALIYEASKWLEDFLIKLQSNPIVMHCTYHGEISVR
ncbi:hypothetical protein KHC33_12145 [Methanospirillum sp. J.3.6.1-F.2.7.3]|uniref:Uncharacterized protein n=1 Tax=Methanospirillum purgamenti TaxID=2834276 RepID=A0A8E7EJ03_9EURY|nr:hypothetical protein [Methanospirillum sp. J.3.6.1-F.2.7.3]QVV88081.1 hypothetical protein KHC33_12145 [Methanospirillum sp. J.3.6.1-F.2.7.3]